MADNMQELYAQSAGSSPEKDRQVGSSGFTRLMVPFSLTLDQPFEESDKFHSPARGLQGLAYS